MSSLIILASFLLFQIGLGSTSCLEIDEFDFIVVGSGATGSVVAARLSEDETSTVLLLEAGGEPSEKSNIPLLAFENLETEMDWNYTSTPQKYGGFIFRKNMVPLNRGKTLGGTASLNSMAFTRGNRKDFDLWAKEGNAGWSFKDVLPYFLKMEDYQVPHSSKLNKYHSKGGPITISVPQFKTPMATAFLNAANELGQPLVDYNSENQTGFMFPPVNMKNGARCSSYVCYLKPVMSRPNLHILTYALATKIIVNENKQTTGVQYKHKEDKCIAKVRKEVVVSGGAYNSPQLLMLSGIGPKKTLNKFDIPIVAELSGVGQNLEEHVAVAGEFYTMKEKVTLNKVQYRTKKYLDEWYANKTGPMTVPAAFEGVAFYQSKLVKNETDYPDIEIYFSSDIQLTFLKDHTSAFYRALLPKSCKHVITPCPILLRPKSRGEVTIRSKNAQDDPIINPNLLSHPNDIDTLVEAVKFARKLINTKEFKKFGPNLNFGGVLPNCALHSFNSNAYLKCFVKETAASFFHPSSTCKMGPKTNPMAVVDNRLRVHGIKNLRIADASVMPHIISGHPNAACMMIGEKVSDMIKDDNNTKK